MGTNRSIIISYLLIFILLGCLTPLNSHSQETEGILAFQNEKIKGLEKRISDLEKELKEKKNVETKVTISGKDVSENDLERFAIKKLVEISDKNLEAPTFMVGVLTFLLSAILALIAAVGWFIRKNILANIEDLREETRNRALKLNAGLMGTFNNKIKEYSEMMKEFFQLMADYYDTRGIDNWDKKNYTEATEYGEAAIKYAKKAFGEEPKIKADRIKVNGYKSNLAYYYAEIKNEIKADLAIEYAKAGLEGGIERNKMDFIDNFLYVLMIFSSEKETDLEWKRVYEKYKDSVFKEVDLTEDEKKLYEEHYGKLSQEYP